MSNGPDQAPHPAAYALALLGMVAGLVCLLSERVLPRIARDAGADMEVLAAYLEVHHAMQLLAAAAWREIETVPKEAGSGPYAVTVELDVATRSMHATLTRLMTLLASRPMPHAGRPRNDVPPRVVAIESPVPVTASPPPGRRPAERESGAPGTALAIRAALSLRCHADDHAPAPSARPRGAPLRA